MKRTLSILGLILLLTAVAVPGDETKTAAGAKPTLRSLAAASAAPAPLNISNSSSDSSEPWVGVDGNGFAYAVWYEHLRSRTFYFSTNKAGAWSTPVKIEELNYDTEESGWPVWAVSPSGAAHLTFFDAKVTTPTGLTYDVFDRAYENGTWGPTSNVSSNAVQNQSIYPGMAINPVDNYAYVVWSDHNGTPDREIKYRYRKADGSWVPTPYPPVGSRDTILPGGYGDIPRIAVDGAGTAHMVWGFIHGRTIWYSKNRTPQNKAAWTTPIPIKADAGNEWSSPTVTCDNAGNAYVLWMNGPADWDNFDPYNPNNPRNSAEIFVRKVNSDSTLGWEKNVSQSAAHSYYGSIAVNPAKGDIAVAWTERGNIFANILLDGTWTGPGNLTNNPVGAESMMPSVAADKNGKACLVYTHKANANSSWEIIFMTVSQGTASPLRVTSPNGGETWTVGSARSLTWTSAGTAIANVKIEYSTNNGGTYTSLAASAPNTGTYAWTVPNTVSRTCLVKISDAAAGGTAADTSDAVFAISDGTTASPTIALSRTKLTFGAVAGGTSTQSQAVVVSNTGAGQLVWTATSPQPWITVSPGSGAGTQILTIGVNLSGLSAGTQTGSVSVADSLATNTPQTISITLNVLSAAAGTGPFGSFDTPLEGAKVSSSVPISGWALDDVEITGIKIYRNPVSGEQVGANGYIFIGDAVFVEGSRPDVERIYASHPYNYRAGWGYMLLTNFFPNQGNGTFVLHSIATDKEGRQTELGARTIVCDNAKAVKPFGAIDTPAQGGTISGNPYLNFGWVLTPQPNMIPIDGSTLQVWIDGAAVGRPVYNKYRADIATKFPNHANAGGAIGYYSFDATKITNGVHSIAWSARDSAGNEDGIGSRFFTVLNSGLNANPAQAGSGEALSAEALKATPIVGGLVKLRTGFRRDAAPDYRQDAGFDASRIEIRETDRIELDLGRGLVQRGYLIVGDELRPLPIGSTLDSKTGIFSWIPGPGFLGDYALVFVQTRDAHPISKRFVTVKIRPKFEELR